MFNFLIHVVAAAVLVVAGIIFLTFGTLVVLMLIDAIKEIFMEIFEELSQ